MGALDQAEASRLLRASLGIATYPAPTTPMMLRTMTANGSASSNGTQSTGGSYTPQNLTTALGTEANGTVAISSPVTFTGMPASTVVGVEVWDSNGTPRRAMWGALSASKTLGAGDSLTLPASTGFSFNINN